MFSQASFGDVSLRRIAAQVGIDAAMILRHFGSKEKLFAEAMQRPDLMGSLLQDFPRDEFGERSVRHVLAMQKSSREYHMLLAMLRSTTHTTATESLPVAVGAFTSVLAEWLGGAEAELRASLIASQLVGLLVMSHVFANGALQTPEDADTIVARVAPGIQSLVDLPAL